MTKSRRSHGSPFDNITLFVFRVYRLRNAYRTMKFPTTGSDSCRIIVQEKNETEAEINCIRGSHGPAKADEMEVNAAL